MQHIFEKYLYDMKNTICVFSLYFRWEQALAAA